MHVCVLVLLNAEVSQKRKENNSGKAGRITDPKPLLQPLDRCAHPKAHAYHTRDALWSALARVHSDEAVKH
eukprot:36282-Eustigmatos_ZCMA.PRE.1